MPVSWTEDLSVNNTTLNAQHKKLLNMLNELETAILLNQGDVRYHEIITKMSNYAKEHFQTEEALLTEHAFPDVEEHISEHDEFVANLMILMFEPEAEDNTPENVLAFLKEWLVNHIMGTDKQYAAYLSERGAG
ncbi:MAG: hypothetical protein D6E12_01355 [Desulfovibrio sp.]|nr:MAG: hypothetical protein D6E12_01355 [Desulfovibrio sp.]